MLLAELEIWHTRPLTPTRRVSLGHLVLPTDPAPGFGGLLLGAIVSRHIIDVDEDLIPDTHRLVSQIERGERVAQPRLRHRRPFLKRPDSRFHLIALLQCAGRDNQPLRSHHVRLNVVDGYRQQHFARRLVHHRVKSAPKTRQ